MCTPDKNSAPWQKLVRWARCRLSCAPSQFNVEEINPWSLISLTTLSMKLWIFLLRSVMPTDLTLVFRNSANCAETALASGGSDGRSARVGDRALASSSKALRGKNLAKRGSNSPTKTPFTTKAALKIHDAPITAYLITLADSNPHWTKDQRFTFHKLQIQRKVLVLRTSLVQKTFLCDYPGNICHTQDGGCSWVIGVKGVE